MNIFFLDTDPHKAAAMLCDKHLSKMQLETAQMLSTACRVLLTPEQIGSTLLYQSTHKQHPSSTWIRASAGNLHWIAKYVDGMDQEWLSRKPGRSVHASYHVSRAAVCLLLDNLDVYNVRMAASRAVTSVPLCMPEQYWPGTERHVSLDDAVSAYRNYYRHEKAGIAKWPANKVPYWWTND